MLISRAFRRQFVIPEFEEFTDKIEKFYWQCKNIEGGKVNAITYFGFQIYLFLNRYPHFIASLGSFLYPAARKDESKLLGC